MEEMRQEFFVESPGTLVYSPWYGMAGEIKTWYFTLPGQEHVPGRYTLRWRQYKGEQEGFLQIKKNPYKFKLACSLAQAEKIFALEEKTGNPEADAILMSIGPTKVVFILTSIREHVCEGPGEQVRVTCDRNITVLSPSGNCLGTLPDRCECKVYGDVSIGEVVRRYGLLRMDSMINKRIQAFQIVDQVKLDAFKFLPGREVEIKFDSHLGYEETVALLKGLKMSAIKFLWQSFEHVEENTHVYYRAHAGAFREIFKDGQLIAIVRKTDAQSVDREEVLCDVLPADAVLLGGIDRKKFKSYLVDTVSGHCFQLAVDESRRQCDGAVMVQIEAEYIRSIYPWSEENTIFVSLEVLNMFLAAELAGKATPTKKRKIDFVIG